MPNPPVVLEPKKVLRTLRTVWVGMLASLGLYAYTARIIHLPPAPAPKSSFQLSMVGLGIVFAAVVLYLRMARMENLLSQLESGNFKSLAQKIYATYIISFVFSEATALFGFSLFFVHADPKYYISLYLGGVLLMLFCYPRLPLAE